MADSRWATMRTPRGMDVRAPDGSEIRLLPRMEGRVSVVHCLLPAGGVSQAVRHRTVDEVWYVLGGRGEVWRRDEVDEEVVAVRAGVALTIPAGTSFQFRTLGPRPLRLVIATLPPWPGDAEAAPVAGYWEPRVPEFD